MNIENTQECFVQLWLWLERTRLLLYRQCKRFCVRRVLKSWFGGEANDDFIWTICSLSELAGWDELPLPSLSPRKHRELLRAIVAVKTGISFYKINLKALDAAYSIAFPKSTPLNVNKKAHQHQPHPQPLSDGSSLTPNPSPIGEGSVQRGVSRGKCAEGSEQA